MASFYETDFTAIDPYIKPWAATNGLRFLEEDRDYEIRSIWLGQREVQIWLETLDDEGYTKLHISKIEMSLASKWGKSIVWRTKPEELPGCLDIALSAGRSWIEEG
jgi:hypothetical protein